MKEIIEDDFYFDSYRKPNELLNLDRIKVFKGNVYFGMRFQGNLPNLERIEGDVYFGHWSGTAKKLKSIGGYVILDYFDGYLPALRNIGNRIHINGSVDTMKKGRFPNLKSVNGRVFSSVKVL